MFSQSSSAHAEGERGRETGEEQELVRRGVAFNSSVGWKERDGSNGEKDLTDLPCDTVRHLFWELGWSDPILREKEHFTKVGWLTDAHMQNQGEVRCMVKA